MFSLEKHLEEHKDLIQRSKMSDKEKRYRIGELEKAVEKSSTKSRMIITKKLTKLKPWIF